MSSLNRGLGLAATLVLAFVLSACGSASKSPTGSASVGGQSSLSSSGYQSPITESLSGGKRGGTLTVLDESDFEHLDPGMAYYAVDYEVIYATQRPLYSFKPNTETQASPDMAAGPPEISADHRTITVHLKHGVHFSPPVNREVTAEDVAYAIERGANPNVANPYLDTYFDAVEGVSSATGGPIKGITTPNKHEIVFKLTEPKAGIVIDALALPLTAAVPKQYAERFDRHSPSDYASYEVATGPYMLKNDAAGKVFGIGYVPGQSATLVRNPNWRAGTDIRPAYLNEIDIKIGGNTSVIGRQVLEGSNVVQNEAPSQANLRLAVERHKSQLEISPSAGSHDIGVNNKVGPFKNVDLRKALWAALDRSAMDKARGGSLVTNVATHFLYPGIPGFEQAGGLTGPKVDYNEHPEGSIAIAQKYMRLAGYPSGKYTGTEAVTVVGAKGYPAEQDAEIVNSTLKQLGFTTKFTLLETSAMYAKYCNVPKEEVTICPSVSWLGDFADGQAVLNITFNGKFINETGNANWGQTNDPAINAAATAAESTVGIAARARAWANVDEKIVQDAAEIPFDWDKQASIEGSSVHGVGDLWDVGEWDYSWTSLG
jgi:peptide/nickel transport system substrate-binding protein